MLVRIITLLGGISILIYGLNLISVNTESLAVGKVKRLIRCTVKTPIGGFLTGLVVSGVTQSSVAVNVVAVGLVETGVIPLCSAFAVIMGANVGTTVTAQLISVSGSIGGLVGAIASIIGLLTGFCKNNTVKNTSNAIMGLGILFTGLSVITTSVKGLTSAVWFQKIFLSEYPLLSFLNGMVLTGITQSSSAITGVMVVLGASGVMQFTNSAFIILGCNVGSCFFVVLSSLNKNEQARRASLFNLLFNLFGAIIFIPVLFFWGEWLSSIFALNSRGIGGAIADFHTIFNFACSIITFPFLRLIEKLTLKIIPPKNTSQNKKAKSFTVKSVRFN